MFIVEKLGTVFSLSSGPNFNVQKPIGRLYKVVAKFYIEKEKKGKFNLNYLYSGGCLS
jgi:hypothetical protein